MPELKAKTNKYNYKTIVIEEKIKKDELGSINFNSTDSYILFESDIKSGGKDFNLKINFDQGRRTTNFLHPIILVDGGRKSLGFTNNQAEIRNMVNEFIFRSVGAN